jgi:serine/threonine-protein kinase HipA
MTAALLVRIDDDVVGRLWLDAKKRFCFQYSNSWLEQSKIPLSLSLPLRILPLAGTDGPTSGKSPTKGG